jgi:hypothetical protein
MRSKEFGSLEKSRPSRVLFAASGQGAIERFTSSIRPGFASFANTWQDDVEAK